MSEENHRAPDERTKERLDALLAEWEERKARGAPVDPHDLCPDDPALARALAEQIRNVERCDRFLELAPWGRGDPSAAPAVPTRIGKYEVVGELGHGGMGIVYEARNPVLGSRVAIKVIRPRQLNAPDRAAEERFVREGRALAELDHPNIVTIYDADVHDGRPYLVMELVPNGSLAKHRKRLTAAGAAVIGPLVEKVARAVHYAHTHRRQFVHRDLKPGNILLDEADEPHVADFGLVKSLEPAEPVAEQPADGAADTRPVASALTAGGPMPGTWMYMSPEQRAPSAPVGPRADVWALGVILHELLTGELPPDGVTSAELSRRLGRRLAAVVARCLQPKADQRYASAEQLADALRAARQPTRRGALIAGAAAAGFGLIWAARSAWSDPTETKTGPDSDSPPPKSLFPGYTDEKVIDDALRRLADGQPVTLIDGGLPKSYRLGLGPGTCRVLSGDGAPFRLQADGIGLLELLPRLPPGAWSVEARVRHERAPEASSQVGIYAAHYPEPVGAGVDHSLISLSFTERIQAAALAGAAGWAFRSVFFLGNHPRAPLNAHADSLQSETVLAAGPPQGPTPYRLLRLGIDAKKITFDCDGNIVKQCEINKIESINKHFRDGPGRLRDMAVRFEPFAALGVFVSYGTVRVESFVVRPRTV